MKKLDKLKSIFLYIGQESERMARSWHLMDMFAELRNADSRLTWENETNRYQVELRMLFAEWMDDLIIDMAEYDYVVDAVIAASLERLHRQLVTLSRQRIFEGYDLGFGAGTEEYTVAVVEDLASVMVENEDYIEHSFIPDVRTRIQESIQDEKFLLLGGAFIISQLVRMSARLEMYAGAEWKAIGRGVGAYARSRNLPVFWVRDGQAEHCETCLEFGNRTYNSYDELLAITGGIIPADGTICRSNCRCSLMVQENNEWIRP